MTFEEFNKFQEEFTKEVVGMKDTKGKEYAHSEDRFANFNRLADEIEVRCPHCQKGHKLPNYVIAWVYLKKHLDSIVSFFKEGKTISEPIRGRFVDAVTYMELMAGMIEEQMPEKLRKDKVWITHKYQVGAKVRYGGYIYVIRRLNPNGSYNIVPTKSVEKPWNWYERFEVWEDSLTPIKDFQVGQMVVYAVTGWLYEITEYDAIAGTYSIKNAGGTVFNVPESQLVKGKE